MTDDFTPDVIASTLKRVDLPDRIELATNRRDVRSGDIVAFTVIEEGGSYDQVEKRGGEHVTLEEGMTILGVFSPRKAVKGFVGEVPDEAEAGEVYQFIGGGGVIGNCLSFFEEIGEAYDVRFEGFVTRDGETLNVDDFAVEWVEDLEDCPPLIMVAGTRMDSGKTTLAANLLDELDDRGYEVGAVKLTGFTRQRDRIKMQRHGAVKSLDFVDAGILSSMIETDKVIKAGKSVLNDMAKEDVDAIVVELGGGLIGYDNVEEVLTDDEIVSFTAFTAMTAMDPVAAYGAMRLLEEHDLEPDLFSGPATDTRTGKDLIQDSVGITSLNGRKDVDAIADLVEGSL